jgi:hypothetical protein
LPCFGIITRGHTDNSKHHGTATAAKRKQNQEDHWGLRKLPVQPGKLYIAPAKPIVIVTIAEPILVVVTPVNTLVPPAPNTIIIVAPANLVIVASNMLIRPFFKIIIAGHGAPSIA